MNQYKYWSTSEDGYLFTLTLHGSDKINSLNAEVMYELRDITASLRTRNDVWAVVLQGAGKHFSGGIDLNVIQERLNRSEAENRAFMMDFQGCLTDFESLQKPTIAKLRGFCLGGGLILALCCDFRIASQRTIFSLPEIKLGLAIVGSQRVTRVAGIGAAKELILLGKRFNAQEAHAYGLVNRVVNPEELDSTVSKLTSNFERLPPRSVGVAKRIINGGHLRSMRHSQDFEIDAMVDLLETADIQEAVNSYIEKRSPHYTGG